MEDRDNRENIDNCGNGKAIYNIILENIGEDGSLPRNFSIDNENDNTKLRFAPGAMDGMMFYHAAAGDSGDEIPKELSNIVNLGSEGRFDEAGTFVRDYADNRHVLRDIDALQGYIFTHSDSLNPGNLMRFAVNLATRGEIPEEVKLGLALMEVFEDISRDEKLMNIVRTLSLYDEFTLFGAFIFSKLPKGNEEMFRLLPKIEGWGRIHLVRMIEADTPEIKEWLALNGVHNEVLPAYSGLDCFGKIDYLVRLEDTDLDLRHYRGLADILEAMMDEGPVAGISCIENKEQVSKTFARVTMARNDLGFEDYSALTSLVDFLEGKQLSADNSDKEQEQELELEQEQGQGQEQGQEQELELDDATWIPTLLSEIKRFLSSDKIRALADEAMENGKGFSLAETLGIPYFDQAYTAIKKDPASNAYLASKLIEADFRAEEMVGLYYNSLQLEEICTGSCDEMGLGDGFRGYWAVSHILQGLRNCVGIGEDFIYSALASPVIHNRNAAISALERCMKKEGESLSELSTRLYGRVTDLLPREVNDDVRERMEKLIGLSTE